MYYNYCYIYIYTHRDQRNYKKSEERNRVQYLQMMMPFVFVDGGFGCGFRPWRPRGSDRQVVLDG